MLIDANFVILIMVTIVAVVNLIGISVLFVIIMVMMIIDYCYYGNDDWIYWYYLLLY